MSQSYGRLGADFYDAEKGIADAWEVDFFAQRFASVRDTALEAMCGSGRLLIPLCKRGYRVEGVDNSPAMLENLDARFRLARLTKPNIYLQSLTHLILPGRYPLIFIALGSFQLLPEEETGQALERLRAHLMPGGKLVLDTFIPWDLLERDGAPGPSRRMVRAGQKIIHLRTETRVEPGRQRYVVTNHYEHRENGVTIASEEETLTVRWYFPEELIARLQGAGFSARCQGVPVTSPKPRRYLYEASWSHS